MTMQIVVIVRSVRALNPRSNNIERIPICVRRDCNQKGDFRDNDQWIGKVFHHLLKIPNAAFCHKMVRNHMHDEQNDRDARHRLPEPTPAWSVCDFP